MRLYLVRHAIAVSHGTPGFAQDAKRPLTDEGQQQARDIGAGLKRLKISVETIATSPYVRAQQTAEALARALGEAVALKEMDELRAEATPEATSLALSALSACERLILVGHEPHLSAWVGLLVGGREGLRCVMKKGSVACVDVEQIPPPAGSGTLRWLMTPRQLSLIGHSA